MQRALIDYPSLTAMIAPAIFLTANGSLIISTSNRMSRIVDRIRILNELGDELSRGLSDLDFPDLRLVHAEDQLRRLVWRSDRIRYALAMLYLAFGAFVGTSLALGANVLLGNRVRPVPTLLALIGVSLMLVSCINLVREAFEALRSNRLEIRFFHELRDRRRAERSTTNVATAGAAPAAEPIET